MGLLIIDGKVLKNMIVSGANEVTEYTSALNALNVFPVPDGDTGTNMGHTVRAAALEAIKQNSTDISVIAKAASSGALRGARGNSGVILSQLFRGLAKGLEGKTEIDAEGFAEALAKSSEMAYKAVMKPKEGTMLTIGRAIAEAAYEIAYDEKEIRVCLEYIIERADAVLAKTPDMLPVLKEAGVVDSGGMGVVYFYKGALKALEVGSDIVLLSLAASKSEAVVAPTLTAEDIIFAYCTEFLVEIEQTPSNSSQNAENILRDFLPTIGDSVVVIEDMGLVKVHVHTNNPGKVLEKGLEFGQLINIKIENMKEQHTEMVEAVVSKGPVKPIGIVAVAAGKGMTELFKNLGADYIIEGGQSMNPSTEDIAAGIERVNAETVIVLPNNKNIILTAEQAAEIVSNKSVKVMATRSIPQGIACVVANSDTISLEDNLTGMIEAMEAVHSGQVTRAVRDTVLDGHNIKEGDFLCLYDGDIALVKECLDTASKALAEYMCERGGEIVSIYFGEGTDETFAMELSQFVTEKYPMAEVEVHNGGQPLYSIIMSVE